MRIVRAVERAAAGGARADRTGGLSAARRSASRVSRREFLADAGSPRRRLRARARAGPCRVVRLARARSAAPSRGDAARLVARHRRATSASPSTRARSSWALACRPRSGRSSPRSSTSPFDRIAWVQGDSERTVDQGRTVGSGSVKRGGAQLRRAAAEARAGAARVWRRRSSACPSTPLVISDGVVVGVRRRLAGALTFGELIGGGRFERRSPDAHQSRRRRATTRSSAIRCRASRSRRR